MFALVASSIRLIVYAPPLLKVMRGLSPMSAAFVVSLDRVGVRRRQRGRRNRETLHPAFGVCSSCSAWRADPAEDQHAK